MGGFLILIVILAAIWALLVLPARRRRGAHAAMQDSVDAGDEIITAGGLHGVVTEIGEDTARVELAPGVVVTLDRRAIAAVARDVDVAVDPAEAEPGGDEPAAEAPAEPS